jgi:hypothetical protein
MVAWFRKPDIAMRRLLFLLAIALVVTASAQAQNPAPRNANRDDDGPWNHRILLATSMDGLAWTVGSEVLAERASVPELFEGPDGQPVLLFVDASGQFGPGALGVLVRGEGGNWERRRTNLRGADPNVVKLKDGTYRAYSKDRDGAIMVFSSPDGLKWDQEGVAFQDQQYGHTTDSDVFETPGGWVMLISLGPRMLRCTSTDGLRFTAGEMLELGGSVSDTVPVTGGWRTYFHVNASPRTNGKMLIRSAFTADGKTWKVEAGDRVVAPSTGPAQYGVADPAPLRLKDGTWLMAVKSFMAAPSQRPMTGNPSPPQGGPGLARTDSPGPWDSDVLVYRAAANGRVEQLATFERAGVPTIARLKDGRLIAANQHFPTNDPASFDKVAMRFSSDDGKTWTAPEVLRLAGLPEGMRYPFDPTLVPLPDGRVRVYFTSLMGRQFTEAVPAIYSAISTNGVDYTFEPGMRFGVEGRIVIDCAVVLHQGVFHLYSPDNGVQLKRGERPGQEAAESRPRQGVGYHATSRDGLQFTREADVTMDGRRSWLGNAQSDGKLITFFGTGVPESGPGQPRGGFWTAKSKDGKTWEQPGGIGVNGGDPGAVADRAGGWVVVITGAPRAGTPSAQRRGGNQPPSPPNNFQPGNPAQPRPLRAQQGAIRVTKVESRYATSKAGSGGRLVTGQDADVVLGAKGFNQSGGPLLFNHPTGLATDGRALLMTDRWNNRVLIWKSAPARNTPPDLVLGQKNFDENNAGKGRGELNWPGNVAVTPEGKVVVTDTDNDRVLIWNSFPAVNGAPADRVLELAKLTDPSGNERPARHPAGNDPGALPHRGGTRLGWPWGVWTDGAKLAVVATHGSAVLIWNQMPTRDNQSPDLVLRPSVAGTPRNVTSDGRFFAVSDHNNGPRSRPATMVWRTFPTSAGQEPDFRWGEWLKGTFTGEGKLIAASMQSIYVWNQLPRDPDTDADVVLRPKMYRNGDGPDVVIAKERMYVGNYNGNNVLVWNGVPTRDDQAPDFALGSDTPEQDTWAENFLITNPVLATDGKSLFASSDFDRKMFVWRKLPDESGAKPDLVYSLPEGPWDNALHGSTLVLAGRQTAYVWKTLPLQGEMPDVTLNGPIGGADLREITGVALDEKYFYLSDRQAGRIYVWEGIPTPESRPVAILNMERCGRLSSDGTYLVAAPFEGSSIQVWRVADLAAGARPTSLGARGQFNLPGKSVVAHGGLFVADTSFNRVHAWHRIEDALAGRSADALLGARDDTDRDPGIGRNSLFMPGTLAYDGRHLWVGEFKFSSRILRFTSR